MKRLYVGNLSWTATEDDLRERFGNYGLLTSVRLITDRETGKSKGFAFVEFEDEADARRAKEEEHGESWMGRSLKVDAAVARNASSRDSAPRRSASRHVDHLEVFDGSRGGGGFEDDTRRRRRSPRGNKRDSRR